jgi:hypothetical protein
MAAEIELDALSRGALDLIRRPPHHPAMDRRRFLVTALAGPLVAPQSHAIGVRSAPSRLRKIEG